MRTVYSFLAILAPIFSLRIFLLGVKSDIYFQFLYVLVKHHDEICKRQKIHCKELLSLQRLGSLTVSSFEGVHYVGII